MGAPTRYRLQDQPASASHQLSSIERTLAPSLNRHHHLLFLDKPDVHTVYPPPPYLKERRSTRPTRSTGPSLSSMLSSLTWTAPSSTPLEPSKRLGAASPKKLVWTARRSSTTPTAAVPPTTCATSSQSSQRPQIQRWSRTSRSSRRRFSRARTSTRTRSGVGARAWRRRSGRADQTRDELPRPLPGGAL